MGKISAKIVFESSSACLSSIGKLLQMSYGKKRHFPNVNLSFPDRLEEDMNEKKLSQLIHIGSYGLHTLHHSMKHGEEASGWNVNRSDYSLQVCAHHWSKSR